MRPSKSGLSASLLFPAVSALLSRFVQKSQLWPLYKARGLVELALCPCDFSSSSGSAVTVYGSFIGDEASDCDALRNDVVVRSMDMDVLGVPVGLVSKVSFVFVGCRTGDSWGVEWKLRAARDFRGEALRRGREFVESKLACDMLCRHVIIRSFGGCVDTLSRRDRLVRDMMLLGRPIPDILFMDAVSHCSLSRMRFWWAQSCLNTFSAPV